MTHYGIWFKDTNGWMEFSSGEIFWTTSLTVAEAQMMKIVGLRPDAEVRRFPDK